MGVDAADSDGKGVSIGTIGANWYEPREVAIPSIRAVDRIYNLELNAEQSERKTIVANGVVCSTLGWGDGVNRIFQGSDYGKMCDAKWGRGWKNPTMAREILADIVPDSSPVTESPLQHEEREPLDGCRKRQRLDGRPS